MHAIELPDATMWGGALLLSDLGVISAEGADAGVFLHGQLSQDMTGQPADEARLAAYCSAKGRMLASFTSMRPAPDAYWLLTDRQVLPPVLKRLSMFVLRAKARLSDASDALAVIGLLGEPARAWLGDLHATRAWQVQAHPQGGYVLRLPDVLGASRWYWIGPSEQAGAILKALPSPPEDAWHWLDVMSGLPRIEGPTSDQFVPQMINFEAIGGVNFKKGCYPGQEIVARSQYRGTLKRRAFLVHAEQPLVAGQEVFSEADPGQPAGLVINAARRPSALPSSVSGASSALIELKLNAQDSALHVGQPDGPRLALGALPYALPGPDDDA